MRKITIIFLFFCLLVPYALQAQATLTGKIANASNASEMKVRYSRGGYFSKDSELPVSMTGDSFVLVVPIEENGVAYFKVKNIQGKEVGFALYLEKKAVIKLTFDANNLYKTLVLEGDLTRENEHLRTLYTELDNTLDEAKESLGQDTIATDCYKKVIEASNRRLDMLQKEGTQAKWSKTYMVFARKEVEGCYMRLFSEIAASHFGAQIRKIDNVFTEQGWSKTIAEKLLPVITSTDKTFWKGYYLGKLRDWNTFVVVFGITPDAQDIRREALEEGTYFVRVGKKITETFAGEFLEVQYADFILSVTGQKRYEKGLLGIIDDFKQRFPKSNYLAELEENREEIALFQEGKNKALPSEVKIVENYNNINNLSELLAPFKGKVVLVDMWGTWCAPCKAEMKYMPALKEYFKGKDVVYLYIAYEIATTGKEEKWHNILKTQNLAGYHLIGNEKLWEDIWRQLASVTDEEIAEADESLRQSMKNTKAGKGKYKEFPTYTIINEKGEMVVKFAHNPSTKEALYKQIEKVLVK